jgi:hypothetical protein
MSIVAEWPQLGFDRAVIKSRPFSIRHTSDISLFALTFVVCVVVVTVRRKLDRLAGWHALLAATAFAIATGVGFAVKIMFIATTAARIGGAFVLVAAYELFLTAGTLTHLRSLEH